MNWFDIFVVILLLRTCYIGFKNGLSCEVFKAAGLVLSGLAAFYFYKKLVLLINQYAVTLMPEDRLNAAAFLAILLSAILIFKLIFIFVQKIMQLSFAKNFSTTTGMIFGLARGIIIICLTFAILNWSTVDYIRESIQQKSFSGQYIVKINSQLKTILTKVTGGAD